MIRAILQYKIDNNLQEKFIEVMKKVRSKSYELYPDIKYNFFFKWDGDKITKVYYFFEFEDEHAWNNHFDNQQTDPRWIDFIRKEYYPYDFVVPNTSSLEIIHEIGQKPLKIPLGGFDYSYKDYKKVEHQFLRSKEDHEE